LVSTVPIDGNPARDTLRQKMKLNPARLTQTKRDTIRGCLTNALVCIMDARNQLLDESYETRAAFESFSNRLCAIEALIMRQRRIIESSKP